MDLHKRIFGKLYGDKGYISKDLFERLFVDGVHLITKIKKNMKNSLMLLQDKIALRKRALIETVNDELKNICQIEHTRHRSFENFTTNFLGKKQNIIYNQNLFVIFYKHLYILIKILYFLLSNKLKVLLSQKNLLE